MREMKDSGVEWIGQIPKDWDVVPHKRVMHKVKEICEQYNGEDIISLTMNGVIKRDLAAGGKMPTSFDGYQYVKPNDLLLCLFDIDVTPRCVGVVKDYGVTSPAYSRFIMHDGYYNVYYDYLLRAIDDDKVFVHLSKNLRSSLTESDFGAIKTCVPSLAEQHRIATFLDAECAEIDAVLEKTRASIEEYKKLKQAVITQAVTKGIRGDRPMKDSGIEWIGDIPAEWEVVRQKYFWNTVESGVSVNAADKPVDNSEQYGVLKTSAVSKFVFIPAEHKQVNFEEYGRVSCPVRADSIIASRMNTPELVGACGYVQNNYPNLFLPDRLWQITFKDGLSPKYAWYYLSGIRVRQYISSLSTGTSSSMQNISQSQYGNIFITIPDLEEQSEITKYLDEKCSSVDALMAKKQQYLTEIENYKKSLIYEYVTGKKEVKTSVLAD